MTDTTAQNTIKHLKGVKTAMDNGWYSMAKQCLTSVIESVGELNRETAQFIEYHTYEPETGYKTEYVLNDGSPNTEV